MRHVLWKQLHPVKGCQPFLQWHWKLICEASPVVVSHLVLKPMKDLVEHVSEVILWIDPGSHCITEEYKILHYTSWIYTDHSANSSECRVLLLVVPYISQTGAPGSYKLL